MACGLFIGHSNGEKAAAFPVEHAHLCRMTRSLSQGGSVPFRYPRGAQITSATPPSTTIAYRACGNSGRSNQTVSIRAFVLHRLGVSVHPFTKSQRTW
jgi:hypothetical protein